MVEAIGSGASVIAFLGLAGQLVQGCEYVCRTIDRIKEADDDVREFRSEVSSLELIIDSFRNVLQDLETSGVQLTASGRMHAVRSVLNTAQEAVQNLIKLIATNNFSGRKRSKLKFVFLRDTCANTIPARLDEVHVAACNTKEAISVFKNDLFKKINDLCNAVNAISASEFTASTTIVSETAVHVHEALYNASTTNKSSEKLKATSEGLRLLPVGIPGFVKSIFCEVLLGFHLETKYNRDFGEKKNSRAIGILTVQSIITTFNESDTDAANIRSLTVTQTNVELFPNPELLQLGIYCSIVEQGFAISSFAPEPALRVYNIINSNASIVNACISCNLAEVRELFINGHASPYDRLWAERSLLELTLRQIIEIFKHRSIPPQRGIEGLLSVFEAMVHHGLDPGVPRIKEDRAGQSPLMTIAALSPTSKPDTELLLHLARTIIKNSTLAPLREHGLENLDWQVQIDGFKRPILDDLNLDEKIASFKDLVASVESLEANMQCHKIIWTTFLKSLGNPRFDLHDPIPPFTSFSPDRLYRLSRYRKEVYRDVLSEALVDYGFDEDFVVDFIEKD
ncbi:hypothetical protein BPOR_0050g00200 [Botrytis porri]|uniref:Fungal N-terminal domain-containing protein n=1 Tax=Botrytis porri TaxID=87229 RepID=A0A4Z1L1Z4_9HELO|nr:hypothetical protein BPOR_0050g00200 [Botrytis porri]